MTNRIIHGLLLTAESPSRYIYNHAEGPIKIAFYGMIREITGRWKADWRIRTAKGLSARGYRSLEEAAGQLAVSLHNQRLDAK